MKYICFIKIILLLGMITLFSGGCACISGQGTEKPAPAGDPYSVPSSGQKRTESISAREERLINDAVSALSLQIALSREGVCRILCYKKPSVLVEKILLSLATMGLIRKDAEHTLYLSEEKQKGSVRLRLIRAKENKIFFEYHISEQEKVK